MRIRQMLVDKNRYKYKCPYSMNATRIVVHNTANDASANNEIKYMINNNNEVSFHLAVDDKEAVQGIPFNRNTWNAGDGNGKGNREGLSIEICYSKSGGDKFIKAEKNAAKLIATLLKERNWGIDKVTKHQDYSKKYCPHRTLDMGWDRFLNMIKEELNSTDYPSKPKYTGNITYKVYDNIKKTYLPPVINDQDYAGNKNHAIGGIKAKAQHGNLYIKCHIIGKKAWEETVSLNEKNFNSSSSNSYSGILGKNIDMIKIWSDYGHVDYRASSVGTNFYEWVSSKNVNLSGHNSYAGVKGKPIDRIQMK